MSKNVWKQERAFRGGAQHVLEKGDLRMTVMNNHIDYPGVWILRSSFRFADLVVLDAKDEEAAKEEAVLFMRLKLSAMLRSIGGRC